MTEEDIEITVEVIAETINIVVQAGEAIIDRPHKTGAILNTKFKRT